MPVKMILCLLILAQFVCISAICEITSHWFEKKDILELSLFHRESNSSRGWK